VAEFLSVVFFCTLWKLVLDFAILRIFGWSLFGYFMRKQVVLLFFLSEEIQIHLMCKNVDRKKKDAKSYLSYAG